MDDTLKEFVDFTVSIYRHGRAQNLIADELRDLLIKHSPKGDDEKPTLTVDDFKLDE